MKATFLTIIASATLMAQCNAAPKQSAPAVEQPATAAKQTSRVAKQDAASLHDSTQNTAKPAFEVQ
ncbi:MAG: hypothetical protein PUF47_04245, partial [Prevotella stercorea]|nr:hypothetical protein [Leyella stercorea]